MRYAVIDIGSNSVRLTAYRYHAQTARLHCFLNEREMIGLAAYVTDGELSETGIRKLAAVLKQYKTLIAELQITQYYVLATASIRNVTNTEAIVAQIDAMTGMRMVVLDGEEEARLDFAGVWEEVDDHNGIMVDIGGGSTEIILFENCEVTRAVSLPLGSLQLTANHVKGIVLTKKERKAIKHAIGDALDGFVWGNQRHPLIYGIGGTCRCAHRLAQELYPEQAGVEARMTVSLKLVHEMLKEVKADLQEDGELPHLKKIYRTVPERMFSVIPGLMILEQIAQRVHAEELKVCLCGIREGYLYRNILKNKEQ